MNKWAQPALEQQFPQLSGKDGKGEHRPPAGAEMGLKNQATFLLLWWQSVRVW